MRLHLLAVDLLLYHFVADVILLAAGLIVIGGSVRFITMLTTRASTADWLTPANKLSQSSAFISFSYLCEASTLICFPLYS